MSLATVLERLRTRAESDAAFADTLERLAQEDRLEDPFTPPPDDLRRLARHVNRTRQTDRLADLRARSLTTRQVVDRIATISTRKGVDRRRHRGSLSGVRDGNRMLHPEWQFDHRRNETHRGLPEVLAALRQVAGNDFEVDAIAMSPRPEADNASVADLLAVGDVDDAIALALRAGDQS